MKKLLSRYRMILTYFAHSVLSTVLDAVIVWVLLHYMEIGITIANTCGVVAGFLVGFLLDVRRTFRSKYSPATFAVYFGTFLLGLGLADLLITVTYRALEPSLPQGWAYLISKGVSVAVPFFLMYFIRKYAYRAIEAKKGERE